MTEQEIMAAQTEKGGFLRSTLVGWGVPWPPPKGWKDSLINGTKMPEITRRIFSLKCPRCAYAWSAPMFSKMTCPECGKTGRRNKFRKGVQPTRLEKALKKAKALPMRWRGRAVYHARRTEQWEISAAFLDHLWRSQRERCAYCERPLTLNTLVMEHMKPVSRGGLNTEDNVCFACDSCNQKKRAMPFDEWAKIVGIP